MNKQIYIGVGVVVVLAVAGFIFINQSNKDGAQALSQTTNENSEQNSAEDQMENKETGLSNFRALMTAGGSQRCEFSTDALDSEHKSNGVAYISSDKIRVESQVMYDEAEYESSFLDNGEEIYAWGQTPDGEFAIKMSKSDIDDYSEYYPTDNGFDYDEDVEYECVSWTEVGSLFTPPNNVEFMDTAKMFEDIGAMQSSMGVDGYDGQNADIEALLQYDSVDPVAE
ncbi:hypothetical protein KC845_00635 [Candidatus Kaiserbacteria bacterium]|nr:hypothetical protein [Candidatus Kaiserbacteria bacterium]